MKNVFRTGQQKFLAAKAVTGMLVLSVGTQVHAALPTTANPSQAPAQGDYIGLLKGYAYDIALVLGLILGTIAFLVVVNNMIATYNEIGNGRKRGAIWACTAVWVYCSLSSLFTCSPKLRPLFSDGPTRNEGPGNRLHPRPAHR